MRDQSRVGKTASIRYRGGVSGEDAVDARSSGEPFQVILGAGLLPRGVEDILHEMAVGESRTVAIPPDLAYGRYDPERAKWYPRPTIPNGYDLEVGSTLTWTNPETKLIVPAYVTDATQDMVLIDINHPFAGKTVEYWIELVDLA